MVLQDTVNSSKGILDRIDKRQKAGLEKIKQDLERSMRRNCLVDSKKTGVDAHHKWSQIKKSINRLQINQEEEVEEATTQKESRLPGQHQGTGS